MLPVLRCPMSSSSRDIQQYLEEKFASGEFQPTEEFAAEAIRVYRELETRYAALSAEVHRRVERADTGDFAPLDIEAIKPNPPNSTPAARPSNAPRCAYHGPLHGSQRDRPLYRSEPVSGNRAAISRQDRRELRTLRGKPFGCSDAIIRTSPCPSLRTEALSWVHGFCWLQRPCGWRA